MYSKYAELLKERNLKTSDVSSATGIANSVFSNWKNRSETNPQTRLSVENLSKIADFFGVPIEYFLENKDAQNA